MYKIKQIPEDFIVKEINSLKFNDNGNYSYFLLKKRNYNTLRAIKIISEKLKISKKNSKNFSGHKKSQKDFFVNEKNIGFAGNKDKNAITEQIISIKNGNKNIENIGFRDIELKFVGRGNEEVFIGSNKGNEFAITIRNLANKEIKTIENKLSNNKILMPNYFGPQRFSNNNAEIGKSLIKKDFKKAIKLILEANSDYSGEIKQHLEKKPNDFVVALKIIPLKLLKLYVHSYQSILFNRTLEQYIKNNKKLKNNNEKLPVIGFGTEIENANTLKNGTFFVNKETSEKFSVSQKSQSDFSGSQKSPISVIKKIIDEIIKNENINLRDFIIRQIPELSSEGSEREAFIKINDFKMIKQEKDELNKNKEKIIVKFSLPKGCYATVLIENLFG